MAHSPYHFDWNVTPSGLEPPASTDSPRKFLDEFANLRVRGLTEEDQVFLPDSSQMAQNIAMSRFGLGNAMAAQRLAGTNNLINMTGGMGVNSMGQGFGRRQSALTQGFRDFNQQQQAQLQQNIAGFRSDVLGEQFRYQDALTTALGNLIRSGENENLSITPGGPQGISVGSGVRGGGITPGTTIGQFTFPDPSTTSGTITNPNTGRVFTFNPSSGKWELQT